MASLDKDMILTAMKNITTILNFVYLGTKIGLFVYFFQDILNFIS